MQIWKLFIILKQPVHSSVTIFSNLTKLTNYLYIYLLGNNSQVQIHPRSVLAKSKSDWPHLCYKKCSKAFQKGASSCCPFQYSPKLNSKYPIRETFEYNIFCICCSGHEVWPENQTCPLFRSIQYLDPVVLTSLHINFVFFLLDVFCLLKSINNYLFKSTVLTQASPVYRGQFHKT